jgi:glycine/D-amino acid oxidase-like deaminating enzyme
MAVQNQLQTNNARWSRSTTTLADHKSAVPLQRSFWLLEAEPTLRVPAPLRTNITADIAVIGGGFVGLWTALAIKDSNPNAQVVVLEQDVCGGGASGRNGGFVMSWWPKIGSFSNFCDAEQALFLARASEAAIQEIGDFCAKYAIDAHFRRAGWLWTATTEAHLSSWQGTLDTCARLGEKPFQLLSNEEVASRTGSKVHRAGVLERSNATVQPAALVRGMRRVAIERGVQIYENTRVLNFDHKAPVTIHTPEGSVSANSLVLATNAWAAAIPDLSRLIVPVNSSIIVTEPIPERLRSIGWTGGEAITDSQLMVDYYRTTRDGRIAFGKGTGAISYGSTIGPVFSNDEDSCKLTEADFRRTYPMLQDVRITHSWAGPIDRTYDSLPVFGTLAGTDHIHYGIGWSGNGVGPSRIGGKILASLALQRSDQWSQCALVKRECRRFPMEPFRYLGGSLVRNAVIRKEGSEMKGIKPGIIDSTLAKFAPAGLEDKF